MVQTIEVLTPFEEPRHCDFGRVQKTFSLRKDTTLLTVLFCRASLISSSKSFLGEEPVRKKLIDFSLSRSPLKGLLHVFSSIGRFQLS
jgi:hypothetical protein